MDGAFFLRRYARLRGALGTEGHGPAAVAEAVLRMALSHLNGKHRQRELYRIFFYDCPPLTKKVHNPVSGRPVDFRRLEASKTRLEFHRELVKKRKLALRLGYLADRVAHWTIRPERQKLLLRGDITVQDLIETDVIYTVKQKGVDMRIGLDIAALSYKKLVDQIVLVSGDSDFVPAAKVARREGVDFVLDPMGASIREDLSEHVDGVRSGQL